MLLDGPKFGTVDGSIFMETWTDGVLRPKITTMVVKNINDFFKFSVIIVLKYIKLIFIFWTV